MRDPSSPDRIRGRTLQRIREDHFRLHPLCVHCTQATPRRVRPATQLDHIIALINGGQDFDRDDGKNRQGLCDECHARKTALDLGHGPARGADADGWPTDPAHPWNRKPRR